MLSGSPTNSKKRFSLQGMRKGATKMVTRIGNLFQSNQENNHNNKSIRSSKEMIPIEKGLNKKKNKKLTSAMKDKGIKLDSFPNQVDSFDFETFDEPGVVRQSPLSLSFSLISSYLLLIYIGGYLYQEYIAITT